MSRVICILLSVFIMMPIVTVSYAATVTETKISVKGKTPEGVVIHKHKVTLKKGFKFEKVSNGKVNVIGRMRGGRTGITGSFDCTCNGSNGGCDVTITGSSVSCSKSTCSSSCYMIVTIPGATLAPQ